MVIPCAARYKLPGSVHQADEASLEAPAHQPDAGQLLVVVLSRARHHWLRKVGQRLVEDNRAWIAFHQSLGNSIAADVGSCIAGSRQNRYSLLQIVGVRGQDMNRLMFHQPKRSPARPLTPKSCQR